MSQKLVDRYVEIARALKSKHQSGRAFHITVIFDKRKVLAIGLNDYGKEHRRLKYGIFSPTKGGSGYKPSIHSELSAILKLGEEDCSNFTFLNVRIDNNNEPNLAKPCLNCFNILKNQVGFKKIIYTTKRGFDIIK